MEQIKNEMRRFIIDNFLFGQQEVEFKDDDSLLEQGIIDSTGVLELVRFIEDKYQMKVEGKDLIPENLDPVKSLTRFVKGKLSRTVVN